jgi:ABC-2 type transport system permease protein
MRNILLIIHNEIKTFLGKRSFWIMTFIFPAIILLLNLGTLLFVQDEMAAQPAPFVADETVTAGDPPQLGYVDLAGAIAHLPPDVPASSLHSFADEAAAKMALSAGDIERYLLVPPQFPAADPVVVNPDFSLFAANQEDLFAYILTYNLVDDAALAQTLLDPTAQLRGQALAPQTAPAGPANPLAAAVPFIILFVFFFLLITSSGYMLSSVSREKENRTMELLLSSLEPRQLMAGKVLGLGVVALLQMAIWLGGALIAVGGRFDLAFPGGGIDLPPLYLLWALLYFLGGYFLYSALMGIVGAMAPSAREGGQFTFIVLLPLMLPLWFNAVLIGNPNGTVSVALSLIPFTAPVTMMMRMVSTTVPLWQLLIGLAGVLLSAYLCVLVAARFFRADTLLSSASLSWGRLKENWGVG